jgi:hypothetical protein
MIWIASGITSLKYVAGVCSLIATCEADGVNPVDSLADVLIRVQTHPPSRIDELLPHCWSDRRWRTHPEHRHGRLATREERAT